MNETEFIEHHCLRKQAFKSEINALKHLKMIGRQGVIVSAVANAYKCKYCNKWHLGHGKNN